MLLYCNEPTNKPFHKVFVTGINQLTILDGLFKLNEKMINVNYINRYYSLSFSLVNDVESKMMI